MIKILNEKANNISYDTFKNKIESDIKTYLSETYQRILKNVPELTKDVLNETIGVEYVSPTGDLYDLDTLDVEDKEILQNKLNKLQDIVDSNELKDIIVDVIKEYITDIF